MASQSTPAANEAAQAERHSQEDHYVSSSSSSSSSSASQSQSQGSDSDAPDGPLRTATTFRLEDDAAPEQDKDGTGPEKVAPSPGLLEKIMQKLGLNPIMLMSMFKCVSPFPPPPLPSVRIQLAHGVHSS